MSKTIIYTFRTNKFLEKIPTHGNVVFVFGSLKKDLEKFQRILAKERPDLVLGLASVQSATRFEPKAVNCFGVKKILSDGEAYFDLHIPKTTNFPIAKATTRSFCNWTAYRVAKLLKDQNIKSFHVFVHFNPLDLNSVLSEIFH